MNEKEFKENYLGEIKKTLDFALKNPFSDFYKEKYKGLGISAGKINSYQDFCQIPFLEKDEIFNTHLSNRFFVKKDDIERYTFSSGTSNNNKVLIVPRIKVELTKNPQKAFEVVIQSKKILILFPPMSSAFLAFVGVVKKRGGLPIAGDITNLKRTASLAREVGIDGIITTPTILSFFLEALTEVNFKKEDISFISLGGELTTEAKHQNFRKIFLNADITYRYGASESGGLRGYRCKQLGTRGPQFYHPANNFLEIVGNKGNVLDGQMGEIVHTDLFMPKAFPMIRYKTADMGRIEKEACSCGNNAILTLGGRASYDILKFSGITLHTQAIHTATADIQDFIEPGFQMHVYEIESKGKVIPQLVFMASLKKDAKDSDFLKKLIQKSITKRLFLAPEKTLEYFVKNEIFLPLKVEFNQSLKQEAKTKNIVSHLY
jgi:phenylacetate-coenzyme A ligase PaaK-like adenylate-forming protein